MFEKRPTTTEGLIRYYGCALAEITAQCLKQGVNFSYNLTPRYFSIQIWNEAYGEIDFSRSAWFDCVKDLDKIEADIERELEAREVML